jgi:DNA mismatch repair protein MutS
MQSSLLTDKSNNYIAALVRVGAVYGLAFLDLTTAEFWTIELESEQELLNEIFRIHPSELLVAQKMLDKYPQLFSEINHSAKILLTPHAEWHFEHQVSYETLVANFKVQSLDGFGLRGLVAGINAAGALLAHLKDNLCTNIDHITAIATYSTKHYLSLDRTTQRNLELTEPLNSSNAKSTLLAVLDHTLTPMGGRLLKQWIKQPLLCTATIACRQDAIAALVKQAAQLETLCALLKNVGDIERLMMRVISGCASPKDLMALKHALDPIDKIKACLQPLQGTSLMLCQEEQKLNPLPELTQLINAALVEAPPFRTNEGGIFQNGYHAGLDELRHISSDSKSWIANYQQQLKDSTDIKSLKIGFTRVFGYYIEVSKGQAGKMPESFQRQQTLTNAERFTTAELKAYEGKVLNAEERAIALEGELFLQLRQQVAAYAEAVLQNGAALATIDAICSLAQAAHRNHYQRPLVDSSLLLKIENGRHPVIEALNAAEKFIPNDVFIDGVDSRLLLITGPNMAGKSTYIRQVALLVIMAQIGSFIPASHAHIGVIDKVFTRIGASDDLARGQSTFMVEMSETAAILNHASDRSLVILDEIGRGTSTYDGISIAWAVAEHLLTCEGKMAKTLFATHYWELTKLEEQLKGAVNYTVAVHESEEQVRFLRKIIKGSSDKSYGIHVGRLAGLPASVIGRATEILQQLEANANHKTTFIPSKTKRQPKPRPTSQPQEIQLTFFG